MSQKTINSQQTLQVAGTTYHYHSLSALDQTNLGDVQSLPFSLKVLLENLLRHGATMEHCQAVIAGASQKEIALKPARVLMQDFTGVPAVVDLAAMRDAMVDLGGDADLINPQVPVDLVIDHSVQVDSFGGGQAFSENVNQEMQRNQERYEFLRWGQQAFSGFKVVPPGTGICHQVNLEYLAQVAWTNEQDGNQWVYPDTVVGTDSHTTMVNALGVLGWGVGGIEAEAAMLGQPVSMLVPEVIGFKLEGSLREGITATDLVLTITAMLRQKGVVGKFVEFYGSGLDHLPLADRATIANMAPEYGATCGFFPVDEQTITYLELSGRPAEQIELVEAYCKAQGLWRTTTDPVFSDSLQLDLSQVEPRIAGPKRPQDSVSLSQLPETFSEFLQGNGKQMDAQATGLTHGSVVIAAITSCTNTSNPNVLMAAGLVAKKAVEHGLRVKPWVKTSLAPGSKVVTEYLHQAGLDGYLDKLGFNLVGYGCTTCIGNSGPLPDDVSDAITDNALDVCAVLSGNRNFEGRIHPQIKANWLASPPLVIAYALAGTVGIDLMNEPLAKNDQGQAIYLKDIWPSNQEIADAVQVIDHAMFRKGYADVFNGDQHWQALASTQSKTFAWQADSNYVAKPPFFDGLTEKPQAVQAIQDARVLALLGDSITTDHISPAGMIKADSPAGHYLQAQGVAEEAFNSYGSRRGHHEVMMRGTFANIRIRNEMVPGIEGGFTKHIPSGDVMPIYDAAMRYEQTKTPLVVIAGKEYGTGSSRDWAAKGTLLLGVKAVIVESFERIHRSNLIGMGVLPLQFQSGMGRQHYQLQGDESISIDFDTIQPQMTMQALVTRADGQQETIPLLCRIDTDDEVQYYRNGGILAYVLRRLKKN